MNTTRRHVFKALGLSLATSSLSATAAAQDDHRDDHDEEGFREGKVFTSTNAVAGNEVLVYGSPAGGVLALQARLATRGQGTSTGLGNQGAVTLSGDGRHLFVVNALSNSVSTFAVHRRGLSLRSPSTPVASSR